MVEPTAAEARAAFMAELRRDARIIVAAIALLWIILIVNTLVFGGRLNTFGVFPRNVVGLRGIVFAPLLHANVAHLAGNTIGIFMLGGLVVLREESHFWIVTLVGALLGGFGTWLLGRQVMHIGASGVIFAYFGYLVSAGIFERKLGAVMLSVFAALLWGGMIFGVLPSQPGISWESHLFGFIGGAVAARLIARRVRRPS